MWTDEQLLAQGWTNDQIANHRSEEATKGIAEAAESLVPESIIPATVVPENTAPMLEDILSLSTCFSAR